VENHIDQLVPKLSAACHAVRSVLHISNTDTLKSIYFAHFHSLMKHGIIFWANSSDSKKVFTLQKKIVRIMMGVKSYTYIHTYISHFISPKYNGHETGHDLSQQQNTQLNRTQLRLIVHCIFQKFVNCIKWIICKI
jgi:hypothetical protein